MKIFVRNHQQALKNYVHIQTMILWLIFQDSCFHPGKRSTEDNSYSTRVNERLYV